MKTILMFGAIALAASATVNPAAAKKYAFTFASSSGDAYCDGVVFNYSGAVAIGYHVYDGTSCNYQSTEIAGIEGTIKGDGPGKWFFFALPPGPGTNLPGYSFFALLNAKALTWELAYESQEYGVPFDVINTGTLIPKPPAQHGGGKSLGTLVRAGLSHIKR